MRFRWGESPGSEPAPTRSIWPSDCPGGLGSEKVQVASRNIWKSRDDLVAELCRLEAEAGLGTCWNRLRWSPAKRRDYRQWREQLRRSYFSVSDPALRKRLISIAAELDSRERLEASMAFEAERRQFERARSRSSLPVFFSAFLIAAALILLCAIFSGPIGAVAAALPAVLLGLGCLRDGAREVQFQSANARGAVSFAERRRRELDKRAFPFSSQEVVSAAPAIEALLAAAEWVDGSSVAVALPRARRDWVRPLTWAGPRNIAAV